MTQRSRLAAFFSGLTARPPEPLDGGLRRTLEVVDAAEACTRLEDIATRDELGRARDLWAEAERRLRVGLDGAEAGASEEDRGPRGGETALHALRHEVALSRLRVRVLATRARLRRALRRAPLAALASFALVVFAGSAFALARHARRLGANLALGKGWVASSATYGPPLSGAIAPKGQEPFFFHTDLDDEPWIEIDLGSGARFDALTITNRDDCCQPRAIPLVVEASTDHEGWHELARRTESFEQWRPRFRAVGARWVRIRVARRSWLHLKGIAVHAARG